MVEMVLVLILVLVAGIAFELFLIWKELTRAQWSAPRSEKGTDKPVINVNISNAPGTEGKASKTELSPVSEPSAPRLPLEAEEPSVVPSVAPQAPSAKAPARSDGPKRATSGQSILKCPNCGNENSTYRLQCFNCGANLL